MSRAQRLCILAALVSMPVLAATPYASEKPIDKTSPLAPVTQRIPKSKKQLASPFDAPGTPIDKGHGPIVVGPPVETHISKASGKKFDLRSLPFVPPVKFERPEREEPSITPTPFQTSLTTTPPSGSAPAAPSPSAPAPAPLANFDGLDFANWGAGHPPDTNGDVGPTYYIQTINTSIGVFRKSDGARVAAFTFNTFMSQGNFGNLCDTNNFGDPVVLYDSFEDRWVISDFAFQLDGSGNVINPPGSFQCVAVSMSGDPVSGGWNYYSVNTSGGLGDYPKLGIWPDGLYMSVNMFNYPAGGAFENTRLYAFNKSQMYAGSPSVQVISFDLPTDQFTVLPANARLQTGTPPAGSPNYFASVWKFLNAIEIWKFHVDFSHPSLSTVTGPFDSGMTFWWEQFSRSGATTAPTPANALDTLYPRLMVQNQYTNIGGTESLWDAQTVGAGNPTSNLTSSQSAVRYYQVNVTGGTVAGTTPQSFTYSPDATLYRYMPSVAVNRAGDMAIGYSTSKATANPAIVYAGRLAGDAANSITQTEQLLFQGTGSQSGTCGGTCTRWGDYSAMTLDPNGCTFWYTNEYYVTNGLNFNTRIGSFAFPSCTPVGAGGTVSGTVTATAGGAPIGGATVSLGARSTTTDANGNYAFNAIPAGNYTTMTASYPGFVPSSITNVPVTDGGTTTKNFSLSAASSGSCYVDTTQNDFQAGVLTNVDVTTTPGDAVLTKPDLLDQQNSNVNPTGFGITNTFWAGQTFKAAISGKLVRADIELFCASCTAVSPNITVSIRATTGATPVPTGADLATATITGFNDGGAGGLKTAIFSTPFTVTAGTTYAVVFRDASAFPSGTIAFTCSCASAPFTDFNPYANGGIASSNNSGATWAADTTAGGRDINFRIYINSGYSTTGTVVSNEKDGDPGVGNLPNWSTLSFTSTTPANTSVKFQIAGSNNVNGPFSFVGPDGTSATFFTTSGASIAQFNGLRYLEYKALLGTTDTTVTPTLSDVTMCFADVACPGTGAPITPSNNPVCPNATGMTASVPSGGSNYSWSITNGTITAGQSTTGITFTAGASGAVGLQVTYTDATGCVKVSTISIPIDIPTKPTITPNGPTSFCPGGGVTLSSSAPAGNQWFLNSVPIGGATNQTFNVTGSGNYTVQYADINGCLSPMSDPVAATLLTPPLSTITISNTQTVNVTGPGTFTLNFNGAVTGSIAANATAAAVQAALNALPTIGGVGGSVNVSLNGTIYTVTFGGTLTGPQPQLVVTPAGGATAGVAAAPVCPSSQGNQASGPGGLSYSWNITNGTITNDPTFQTIQYTAGTSGDVVLTLTVTDGNGCSATSAPAHVPLNTPPPTPTISADTNATGTQDQACPEVPLTLHANGATGAVSYQWYQDNNTLNGETNSTYNAVGVGTYYVTATDAHGCTTVQSAGYVVQNPTPHSPFISFRNQDSSVTTLHICQGTSQIVDSDSATGIHWWVDGVDQGNGNQSYTFVSTTPSTHTFTAQLNALGCHSQFGRTVTIVVDALPPTPTIIGDTNGTGTQDQACPEQPLTLHATGATGAQSYTWYGDNAVIPDSTTDTLVVTYVANVSVTATNGSCTTAHSATYVVQNPTPHSPFISFRNQDSSVTTLHICQGSSQIIDSDSATGIQWYEDGVAIPTGGNSQSYNFTSTSTPGTHTFTAQLNALGCHSQFGRTVTIVIDALPPTPTISGDTNGTGTQDQACPEQPLTLHANGATGAQSYTWYSDNAVIPNETTSTLVMTGVGNISVTATNGSCTTAHSATYVVQNPTPHAAFLSFRGQASTVTSIAICQGSSVIIDTDSQTGLLWYKDGSVFAGPSASLTVTQAGVYTAQLNALGCHSQFSRNMTVTVNPLPATPTVTPSGPTTFCAGSNVGLTSSSATGYQWLLNGGPIGGATNQGYVATASGDYSVRISDANGCTATSAATTVTVNPIPATPTVTPSGPTTFCAGGSVTLTSSSASGNQWYLNGSPIVGQTSQTYLASSSGDYFVIVTALACSATSATTTVTVNPNPNAAITAPSSVHTASTGNTASVASAGAGATYNWSITNGTITAGSGTNSITFTAGAIGTLTLQVTVTTSASCSDTKSANVNVTIPAVTVTSVSPTSGSINGHTTVTVNGTGFATGATLTFGGNAATSVVVVSATKITAVTPAHAAGQVNVTVTNTDTGTGTLTNGYTYVELFDPNGDHTIDPSDIFYLINYLFMHGPAPVGGTAAGDANGDGVVDPSDIFYLVNYLFLNGPKPYSEPVAHIASLSAPMKGSISLGQPVLRGDRYVIPVHVDGSPSAMSLRLRFDAAGEGVTIHRASGLQPAFEIVRQGDRELTYLVDYDGTMDGIVANIDVPAGTRLSSIEIEADGTLICDRDGIRKATVAAGTLTVKGTSIDGGRSPINTPRSER